jgi:DNA-binding IclR family transcriptional regulator
MVQGRMAYQSFRKVLRVLDAFSVQARLLTVKELSDRTGLEISAVSRITKLLEAEGILERDLLTKRYGLGLKLWQLSLLSLSDHSVLGRLTAALDELAIRTGHTSYLAALDGAEMVFLSTRRGTSPLQVVVTPGERIWAHATAAGKAVLSRLPEEEVRALLPARLARYTPHTLRTIPALLRDLKQTRHRGYAVMHDEWSSGVTAIGVSVESRLGGRPVGISVGLPSFAATREVVESLGKLLVKTADAMRCEWRVDGEPHHGPARATGRH